MNTTDIRKEDLAKQQVMDAVRARDYAACRAAADAAPVGALHECGFLSTVLHVAVAMDSREIVQDLLKRGANPRLDAAPAHSALCTAATYGHHGVLQDLLAVATGYSLQEALQKAAIGDHTVCIRQLLDAGADARAGESDALKWAIIKDAREAIRLLLDAGADAAVAGAAALAFQDGLFRPQRREVQATIDWIQRRSEECAAIGAEFQLF